MKRALRWIGALLALAVVYLLVWPVPIDPAAWTPPAATPIVPSGKLAAAERLLAGQGVGPEAVAFDPAGNLYTGYGDGRVVKMSPERAAVPFAQTGGRPLGMAWAPDGRLIVADAKKGLLAIDAAGKVELLADGYEGAPFGFTDDVDVAPDGRIYFSDASSRFGYGQDRLDIMEHRPSGRVFVYDPAQRSLALALGGLYFANGIAIAADGSFLLVDETGAYRVTRLWLTGPKKGTAEPFTENLPGFPDNITRGSRGDYWVALFSPRVAMLDKMLPYPFARKIVLRLPAVVRPKPVHHGLVVHLDGSGKVLEVLDDDRPEAYAPITSARERDGKLWLGSLEADAIAVLTLP